MSKCNCPAENNHITIILYVFQINSRQPTCGVHWGLAATVGLDWLFERDFQIFRETMCPTFDEDLDFCMAAASGEQ